MVVSVGIFIYVIYIIHFIFFILIIKIIMKSIVLKISFATK